MNRRIVLAQRPDGAVGPQNFRMEQAPLPEPAQGQVLLRTLWLSLDPYMRGRMNEGPSYAPPVAVGEVMCGGTVCRVERSLHADFQPGDLVVASNGWQEWSLSDGAGLTKLDAKLAQPSWALGALGMPGFTAYVGLLDIGEARAGETVAVAAATGAVGAVVGQIAKLKGCRVIGIAGGAEKCAYAVDTLGFDACVDHHDPEFAARLGAACGDGIDVYFENVGGAVLEAVLPLLKLGARVPVCGLIAWHNQEIAHNRDMAPALMRAVLTKRLRLQGFIISDHYARRHAQFRHDMSGWLAAGKMKIREDIIDGLENAPQAFMGLLAGYNFGKLLVRVAH